MKNLVILYSIIAILIFIGAMAANENFNNFIDSHPKMNFLYNIFLIICAITVALIFIKERSGKSFSLNMLITATLIAVVLIGFGILKKMV
jgi:hypothetical protein